MVNILNYSNSFVNPIAYVFRIPEFQQALRSCYTKRKPAVKMVKIERRDQNVAKNIEEYFLYLPGNGEGFTGWVI